MYIWHIYIYMKTQMRSNYASALDAPALVTGKPPMIETMTAAEGLLEAAFSSASCPDGSVCPQSRPCAATTDRF